MEWLIQLIKCLDINHFVEYTGKRESKDYSSSSDLKAESFLKVSCTPQVDLDAFLS